MKDKIVRIFLTFSIEYSKYNQTQLFHFTFYLNFTFVLKYTKIEEKLFKLVFKEGL